MHWYVVANQREAKIYVKTPHRKQLKLLNSVVNPLGMEKRRALIKREAGRGVKSMGRAGSVSFSKSDQYNPQEDAIVQFSRQITQFLRSEKLKNSFQSMTLVAEPHLLGLIKAKMNSALKNSTTHWIKKDLQKKPQNELARFLLAPKSLPSPSASMSF